MENHNLYHIFVEMEDIKVGEDRRILTSYVAMNYTNPAKVRVPDATRLQLEMPMPDPLEVLAVKTSEDYVGYMERIGRYQMPPMFFDFIPPYCASVERGRILTTAEVDKSKQHLFLEYVEKHLSALVPSGVSREFTQIPIPGYATELPMIKPGEPEGRR